MKKIVSILTILAIFSLLIFSTSVNAASLDAIDIAPTKTKVKPGENVTLNVEFGEELGAYTVHVSYDNNIFEYVSAEGGTANDTGTKVIVTFHDTTGGTNPRSNMSVTFKAKDDITTSNPTELTTTLEGLSNPDASISYDDITTPIVKNITVEPEYVDYTLDLQKVGEIIKGQEIPMTVSYSSPMGHYYEHARLVAEATTPAGAEVRLLATDNAGLEHDIIDNGWGDAQGFKIGGKDVSQVLQARGIFSDVGDYKVTLKLIDRDNSDSVIAEETFSFTAVEKATPPEAENGGENKPEQKPEVPEKPEEPTEEETKMPTTMPKTGTNIYVSAGACLMTLVGAYVYYNKKK